MHAYTVTPSVISPLSSLPGVLAGWGVPGDCLSGPADWLATAVGLVASPSAIWGSWEEVGLGSAVEAVFAAEV